MSRLTERDEDGTVFYPHCEGCEDFNCINCDFDVEIAKKLAHFEDLEEAGRLIDTHKAAVILAETFGYEHPCNFNGIDEWFSEVCDLGDLCPDGKMSAIACWEQYFKIKLAELKEGEQ